MCPFHPYHSISPNAIAIGIDNESVVVQCYDSFIERVAKRAKTKTFANIKTFAFAITLVSAAPASNSVNHKLWEYQ